MLKLNSAVPPCALAETLQAVYADESHRKARAALLVAMARVAEEDVRLLTAKINRGLLPRNESPAEETRLFHRRFGPEYGTDRVRRLAKRASQLMSKMASREVDTLDVAGPGAGRGLQP